MGTDRVGKQKFDTSIILCMDRYELWKDIEIAYAIPYHDAVIKHISIMIGEKLVDLYDKILQTKGARLTIRRVGILKYEKWATNFTRELTKNFDYLIFYCASRDGKTIEIMYIIPKFEIYNTNVHIYKNPKYATERWYEKYRVIDEELIKKANEIWKKIIES